MFSHLFANSSGNRYRFACFRQENVGASAGIAESCGIMSQTLLSLATQFRTKFRRQQRTQDGDFVRLGERGRSKNEECFDVLLDALLRMKANRSVGQSSPKMRVWVAVFKSLSALVSHSRMAAITLLGTGIQHLSFPAMPATRSCATMSFRQAKSSGLVTIMSLGKKNIVNRHPNLDRPFMSISLEFHHDEQIHVAIGSSVAACLRAEQDHLLRLKLRHDSFDHAINGRSH